MNRSGAPELAERISEALAWRAEQREARRREGRRAYALVRRFVAGLRGRVVATQE